LKFGGSGEGNVYQAMVYAAQLSMRPGVAKAIILANCMLINQETSFSSSFSCPVFQNGFYFLIFKRLFNQIRSD
jgi:hypothetical protein